MDRAESLREERYDTGAKVMLAVTNPCGTVLLATHDSPTAEIEISGLGPGAAELVKAARVEHATTAGRDVIAVRLSPSSGPARILRHLRGDLDEIEVSVRVPEGTDLVIATGSADTTALGRYGLVTARSGSGSLSVEAIDGNFRLRTASGRAQVGTVSGSARIDSASGAVTCEHLQRGGRISTASGDVSVSSAGDQLSVRTASGQVFIGDADAGARVRSASGDQRVERATAGEVELVTASGDLIVGIARGSAVDVDVSTVKGDLRSDIELAGRPQPALGPPGPTVRLRARTVSGTVRLERAAEVLPTAVLPAAAGPTRTGG